MSQLQVYSANLATGKYKVKKFDEAADFFESLAISNTFMTGKKDTSNFYNGKNEGPVAILHWHLEPSKLQ